MNFVLFLLFGLVVGTLARRIAPGREHGGWLTSIAIGVLGSMLGGWAGQAVGFYAQGETAGFFVSTLTAIVLVTAYHALRRRTVNL